jgi:hypothetical protein
MARDIPAFTLIALNPAMPVSPKQQRLGTKKEQLATVVESKFAGFVARPHLA